jgi:hypothetical protein
MQDTTGPRILNRLSKEADESRSVVDALCRRVLRPDFDSGKLQARPGTGEDLVQTYAPISLSAAVDEGDREQIRQQVTLDFLKRAVTEQEWAEACQRVNSWQDEVETASHTLERTPLSRILAKFPKFPTVDRVRVLLGEEQAEAYRSALEAIEGNPDAYAEFPDERVSGGWNGHTAERAVSLVTDVIAPHESDPDKMASAFGRFMQELRSQNRERKMLRDATCSSRKVAARALGIWLPMPADMTRWESDARTAERAPEFEKLVQSVVAKMRILRSLLQFVPRRKFSNHTVEDMDRNMERMRSYIQDGENKAPRSPTEQEDTSDVDLERVPSDLDDELRLGKPKKKRRIED